MAIKIMPLNGWVCCPKYWTAKPHRNQRGLACGCPIGGPKEYHDEYGWRRSKRRRDRGRGENDGPGALLPVREIINIRSTRGDDGPDDRRAADKGKAARGRTSHKGGVKHVRRKAGRVRPNATPARVCGRSIHTKHIPRRAR